MSLKAVFSKPFVRWLAQSVAIAAIFGCALAPIPNSSAHAAPLQIIITVNTTADEYGAGATCSLREAIRAANTDAAFGGCPAGSGADTINLPAGAYTLAIPNGAPNGWGGTNEDNSAAGDLDILASLTIQGVGAGATIIQAGTNTTNGIDKVLGVNPFCSAGVNVTIDGVTIRYGRNTQPNYTGPGADFGFTGGGLDWCSTGVGSFTLSNAIVEDNSNVNGYGGGLNIDSGQPYTGNINITGVTFRNNHTAGQPGGGLNIYGDQPNITITNCTFTNNQTTAASAQGGAIYYRPSYGGSLQIHGSTFDGNAANGRGGGIAIDNYAASTTIVIDQNTQITNNTAGGDGGGFYIWGNVLNTTSFAISGITLSGNSVTGAGGGLYVNAANVTVTGSGSLQWSGSSGALFAQEGTGNLTVKGLTISTSQTVFQRTSSGTLLAYANNIASGFSAAYSGSGTPQIGHNYWGTSNPLASAPTGMPAGEWPKRLGAPVSAWAEGASSATLGSAALSGSNGTAVIVSHGRTLANAPFGNGIAPYADQMCSDYYDFFTLNSTSAWQVQVPVDNNVNCNTNTLTPRAVYWVTSLTNCSPAANPNCWGPVSSGTITTSGQNLRISGLTVAQLGGTPFTAGGADGSDPTAIEVSRLQAASVDNRIRLVLVALIALAVGATALGVGRARSAAR